MFHDGGQDRPSILQEGCDPVFLTGPPILRDVILIFLVEAQLPLAGLYSCLPEEARERNGEQLPFREQCGSSVHRLVSITSHFGTWLKLAVECPACMALCPSN